MTTYLLLCIFAILLTLISFGLTIGGIIKKNKKVWISSLCAFVILTLISVFTITVYLAKSIDYMASDEFQLKTKKTASNWGKNIGNTVSGAAEGLESTLDEKAITKFVEKSGLILSGSVDALGMGIDNSQEKFKKKVFTDKKIAEKGIVIGRAEKGNSNSNFTYNLYLEFKKDFKGKLRLIAIDKDGNKIDNSLIEINEKAGQEKVYVFTFKYLKPRQSKHFILSEINI